MDAITSFATNLAGDYITGRYQTPASRPDALPFLDTPSGILNLLTGTPFTVGQAVSVNTSGRVVGLVRLPGSQISHAASAHNGPFSRLPALSFRGSSAQDINEAGTIVGQALDVERTPHPVIWPASGGVQILAPGQLSPGIAMRVNESGTILGATSAPVPGASRGFVLAPDGTTITIIPPLAGDTGAVVLDLNDDGLVVGWSELAGPQGIPVRLAATIWEGDIPTDLNTRLVEGTGWVLRSALAVSNTGVIAGQGQLNGVNHAFLLVPEPPPAPVTTTTPQPGRERGGKGERREPRKER
jgi:uncharacterized membrane protein